MELFSSALLVVVVYDEIQFLIGTTAKRASIPDGKNYEIFARTSYKRNDKMLSK